MKQPLDQPTMQSIHHQTGDESNSNLVHHIKSEAIDGKEEAYGKIQPLDQPTKLSIHHQTGDESNSNLVHHMKSEAIDDKEEAYGKIHQASHHQQQQHHQQSHQQHHQDITGVTFMVIDPSLIKHEPEIIITPEILNIVTTDIAGATVMKIDPSQIKHEPELIIMDMYDSDTSDDQNEPHYTNLDQQHGDMKGQLKRAKTWTQYDMNSALCALKNQNMSLRQVATTYGIPSTTLWQKARRMGIETPRHFRSMARKRLGSSSASTKDCQSSNTSACSADTTTTASWTEDSLNKALEAIRSEQMLVHKAAKAFGIPFSTLYKIVHRKGIALAPRFNTALTSWSPDDLKRALEAIRSGHTSVQNASAEFGIPTATLYGRCRRTGIELSRSNANDWSKDDMNEALISVRTGKMSITQAAIHYNLHYNTLYGRLKRGNH